MGKSHGRLSPLAASEAPAVRPYLRGSFDLAVLGLDLLPRTRALQSLDHDAVGGGEPRANDAQTVDDRAELDSLGADRAVVGHREDDLARLVGRDRTVGHQQRFVLAAEQPQPSEISRRQQAVLVLEDGASADGAGLRVERVVDEIHPALVLVVGLVSEPHGDRVLHVTR